MYFKLIAICLLLLALLSGCSSTNNFAGAEWRNWRGPSQDGVSSETALIDKWSVDGENLVWRVDFIGRSTPIIQNGRVYVIGRTGSGISAQEVVACYDAGTGSKIWEYRYNMRNTSVPFNRVGWASMAGDSETGNVYSVGSGAIVHCFDKDGAVIWKRSLSEEYGARTGYGGRTSAPVVDGDLVITGFISAGWGEQGAMKHRHFAFDKRTGETVWTATPGGVFTIPNIYSVPVITVIDGIRQMIVGNSDGNIFSLKVNTGENLWNFTLSKRGINPSVAVDGYRVFAGHGEENVDETKMGRIVAIDGRGQGDITATNELWRFEDAEIGYASPMIHDGRVYFVDNTATMLALDTQTGKEYWRYSLGTVGKNSPVWADGKIYATEVNGRFHILQPGDTSATELDMEEIKMPDGRSAELYSSPAIAYGRIYFTTEEGLYCLGDPAKPYMGNKTRAGKAAMATIATPAGAPAYLQVVPAEKDLWAGESQSFRARLFDAKGNFVREEKASWSRQGLSGSIAADGTLANPAVLTLSEAGKVMAQVGELKGTARIRVFPKLPWNENFESYAENANPLPWIGVGSVKSPGGKFIVKIDSAGNKVLAKPVAARGIQRHVTYFGPSDMSNYIVQVDAKDSRDKRKRSDVGLVSQGYEMDLMGKRQRLELRSWVSEYRIQQTIDFNWDPNRWYTMKLDVEFTGGKAIVRGKVWPAEENEPSAWTISVEDPHPTTEGSPGIMGVSYTEHYYDNLKVLQK